MNSILKDNEKGRCAICGFIGDTELHHVFGGANRSLSDKYGLTLYLCHECHNEPPNGVHHNRQTELWIKKKAQCEAMRLYEWTEDDFRKIFGKSYL